MARIPLSQRPLDRLWFTFFLMHIPTTILIDALPLYPSRFVPQPLKDFSSWYLGFSNDPLMRGLEGGTREWLWFRSLVSVELYFQLPVFIIGSYCLYHNYKKVYPLLLAYGSSTTISVLPCLIYLLTPSTSFPPLTTTPTSTVKDLTSTELLMLLSFYVPFLLIPFGMSVDMGMRILEVIGKEERRGKMSKSR